jgi:hypothetical protein
MPLKISFFLFTFYFTFLLNAQPYKQFTPGEIWKDNSGKHLNVHGGGILFHNGVYYWYGEHKVAGKIGNTAQVGVSCYSSKDL